MANERTTKAVNDLIHSLTKSVEYIGEEECVSDTAPTGHPPSLLDDMMKITSENMEQFLLFAHNTKLSSDHFVKTRAELFNGLSSKAYRSDTAMLVITMMLVTHIDDIIDHLTVKNPNNNYGPNERAILCENMRVFLGDESVWNFSRELIELGDGLCREINENNNGKKE